MVQYVSQPFFLTVFALFVPIRTTCVTFLFAKTNLIFENDAVLHIYRLRELFRSDTHGTEATGQSQSSNLA